MQGLRLSLVLIGTAVSLPLFAANINSTGTKTSGSTQQAVDMAQQVGNSYFNRIFNSTNRPDWLTRTEINYDIQSKNTPVASIETIQPLLENRWSTWFWQGRLAYNDGDGTGNIGMGYRYLTDNRNIMWGLNAFYDETMHYEHKRAGLGGEFFTRYITLRANYYDALSGKRNVGTANSGLTPFYERALSGYDAGIETPVPYISWMRFVAKAYRWKGVDAADIHGEEANLRIFPARQVEMDLGIASDNDKGGQAFLNINYYFGSPAFIENSATTPHAHDTFAAQDLEKQRLQKVIRHNDIVVEKTHGPVAGTLIVSRGT